MSWRQLHAISDRLTPEMVRRLMAAFEADRKKVPVSALVAAIRDAKLSVTEIEQLVSVTPELMRQASAAALDKAVAQAAAVADTDLARLARVRLDFEAVNPFAVQAAREQGALMVTRVVEETKRAIRTITSAAIESGIPAHRAAQLIRFTIGLNGPQALAVVNFRRRLIDAGGTADVVAESARAYTARLLRQRAEMIARTELIDSLTRGQVASWERAATKGAIPPGVKQEWLITPDDRLCELCRSMAGKTAPIGGYFDSPLGPKRGPTLHPMCRCTLVLNTAILTRRIVA